MSKMSHLPLVSFILPNYNNEHVLDMFFSKFIKNNTYENYEFIVTDDGSADSSVDVLKKWHNSGSIRGMRIIEEPHKGIINALNKSLFAAEGDFVIRCDGDATIETKGFVEKFLDFHSVAPDKIGVITSKVISDTGWLHAIGRSVISKEGLLNRGKKPDEPVQKRTWDYLSSNLYDLSDILNKMAEVDTALGVLTFCDRKTAVEIGGFDPHYPSWIEDDDFYLSFRLHNKKVFYMPDVFACHRFSLRGNRNPAAWKQSWYKRLFKRSIASWRPKILKHDYAYWARKWGFDPLNPDMEFIKCRYADTELVWDYDPQKKAEGERIIQEYIDKFVK